MGALFLFISFSLSRLKSIHLGKEKETEKAGEERKFFLFFFFLLGGVGGPISLLLPQIFPLPHSPTVLSPVSFLFLFLSFGPNQLLPVFFGLFSASSFFEQLPLRSSSFLRFLPLTPTVPTNKFCCRTPAHTQHLVLHARNCYCYSSRTSTTRTTNEYD